MNTACEYSLKWRYEFNNIKSGIVTYGEPEPLTLLTCRKDHGPCMGVENVDELYEYKNLGVYKNYYGSFVANIDESIEKNSQESGNDLLSQLC